VICPTSTWGQRLKALIDTDFPAVDCGAVKSADLGLIENWESWELWT
jgi:hypothetical protein